MITCQIVYTPAPPIAVRARLWPLESHLHVRTVPDVLTAHASLETVLAHDESHLSTTTMDLDSLQPKAYHRVR